MGPTLNVGRLRTWHRRLALVIGLFLVFQGLTGAISQYRFWLLGQVQPGYAAVIDGAEADPGEVLALVERQLPGFEVAHAMYPAENARDTTVMVMGGYDPSSRMSRMVTVDQYSGEVVADLPLMGSSGWIGLANTLHKWTIFGTTGRIVLTALGLGTIALAVLGILMYLRTRRYRPPRRLLRWHRTGGLVLSVILLPVAIAGTTLNLLTWYEEVAGTKVTTANMLAGMAREATSPPSTDLGAAYRIASARMPDHRLAAFSPAGPHARYHWFAFNSAQMKRTDVLVDPDDGRIAGIKPSGLMRGGGGLRQWLFPVHSLYVFGSVGGFLAAVMGLSLSFWFVTGILMWRRREKVRKTAA